MTTQERSNRLTRKDTGDENGRSFKQERINRNKGTDKETASVKKDSASGHKNAESSSRERLIRESAGLQESHRKKEEKDSKK